MKAGYAIKKDGPSAGSPWSATDADGVHGNAKWLEEGETQQNDRESKKEREKEAKDRDKKEQNQKVHERKNTPRMFTQMTNIQVGTASLNHGKSEFLSKRLRRLTSVASLHNYSRVLAD